jgi:hypothetical protein
VNAFLWWSGVVAWCAIGIVLLWLAFEIFIVGLANTASRILWNLRDMRVDGRKPKWRKLPSEIVNVWADMVGYRNRGTFKVITCTGSEWRGIGDWDINPHGRARSTTNPGDKESDEETP